MKNLEEFLEKVKPGAKKSPLYEYLPELISLRDKKYTLRQLREFLQGNGVVVSTAWLSAFLLSHKPIKILATRVAPVSTAAPAALVRAEEKSKTQKERGSTKPTQPPTTQDLKNTARRDIDLSEYE